MKKIIGVILFACGVVQATEPALWLSAETFLLDDGTPIATWEDRRGNVSVGQPDEKLRPTFRIIGINHRPSVEFHDTYFEFENTIFNKRIEDLHYFAVVKPALRGGFETLFGANASGDSGLFCLYNGTLSFYHSGMVPSYLRGLTLLKSTDSYLLEIQKINTSLNLTLNGKVELQTQVDFSDPAEFSKERFIGGEGGENFYGQIGELILFESALLDKQAIELRCRLGSIYEIVIEGCGT